MALHRPLKSPMWHSIALCGAADRDLCNAVTLLATAEACNNILTSDDDDVSACLLVLPIRILDLHSTAVVEHGQEGLHLHAQRLHWR